MSQAKYTNALIHETSPYLLQHAHNPVNWLPWGDEALQKAKEEQKPLLVSVGYSACHWCHVMEHESFEDEAVADLMNRYFVCIKVDREERPDVDQVYMNAVQMMTRQGGWPLNVIALPDGRPFWGGTYFPKDQWMQVLHQIHEIYTTEKTRVLEYASQLQEGLNHNTLLSHREPDNTNFETALKTGIENWKAEFDPTYGGQNKAPKFMLPNNLEFLLHYGVTFDDKAVTNHVQLTLDKMAMGGIYDQVGGGFARYSVDAAWKVPHFEKMLYDNAQLVSLYAKAYAHFKNPLYWQVIRETIDFLQIELTSHEGFFFSALDADSEGEEGKFYVWKKQELQTLLGDDFDLFSAYYNINKIGYWEDGNYILYRTQTDETFAKEHGLSIEELSAKVRHRKITLQMQRNQRIRPGLDDKALLSWNAMMSTALLDAWEIFGEEDYLHLALRNMRAIETKMIDDGKLLRTYKDGKAKIAGFLEDYAFYIQLCLRLFECLGNETWLSKAQTFTDYCNAHFWNDNLKAFSFTPQTSEALVSHQYELYDNVIPASNSVMAQNLFKLSLWSGDAAYRSQCEAMLQHQMSQFPDYPYGHSNWGLVAIQLLKPFYEVVVMGDEAPKIQKQMRQDYWPNALGVFRETASELPIFKDRYQEAQTLIYVCQNQACQMPVKTWEEAKKLIS